MAGGEHGPRISRVVAEAVVDSADHLPVEHLPEQAVPTRLFLEQALPDQRLPDEDVRDRFSKSFSRSFGNSSSLD